MDKEIKAAVADVVETLINSQAKKATKFLSPKLVVSASRRLYNNKIDKRDRRTDVVLKIGIPNYLEREFIADCKKANEPFPVKKIQLKLIRK